MDAGIRKLDGVGSTRAALLEKLKITTVGGLINHFPRSYDDRRAVTPISKLSGGETALVCATVSGPIDTDRTKNGKPYSSFLISDSSGVATVIFFNSRYLKISRGGTYKFYGRVERFGRGVRLVNPVIENMRDNTLTGRIVPLYPLTEGLANTGVIRIVRQALATLGEIGDPLPSAILARNNLPSLTAAYRGIHAPDNTDTLAAARRRMAFDELFYLSLGLSLVRNAKYDPTEPLSRPDMTPFYRALPFQPTGAQLRCVGEALDDMCRASGRAMRRMVQGDVGSGKTMVAAALAYAAARSGAQSALMAPTEILASQHFESLAPLMESLGVRMGLLTADLPAARRRQTLENLAGGTVDFVVGTHALISQNVAFNRLRLVVTDEQHRFGVRQRALLREKAGTLPHILVMSATPIPRTLAMLLYADMDLSVIDELPPGRIPVDTRAPDPSRRDAVYGFMLRQLERGRQAFVVCPAIEDNGNENIKSASELKDELVTKYFRDYRVELLHGRLPAQEKDRIMGDFAAGRVDVLVSTTVVEVGVNVPNAVMMVVESADRFGLSQLHQLRGRVGRSDKKSYCVLLSNSSSPASRERLETLCRTNDGLKIAMEDLRMRGPGQFFGERQAGVPGLRVAELGADTELLAAAHREAQDILARDPELKAGEHAAVRREVERLFEMKEL